MVLAEGLEDPEVAACALAERIHLAMRSPVAMGERQLYTSVSIGIARVTSTPIPRSTCRGPMSPCTRPSGVARPGTSATTRPSARTTGSQSHLAHELRAAYRCGQLAVHYQPLFRLGGRWWGWRRCCAGTIPKWAPCPRWTSYRCSSGAVRSFRSDDGC